VLIVQITDTHIMRGGAQARYLSETIAWINAMRPRPAAVVLSGDTANDGQREQYEILRDMLARCEIAVYLVPGNHDRRGPLRDALPNAHFPGATGERLNFALDAYPVRMIGIDTSEPGRLGGHLDDASLAWLDESLDAAPAHPTLIFMHHPPFRTGVNLADMCGFRGVRRFTDIVGRHPAARRIISGHVHCERRAEVGGALATTSISTTPQLVPEVFERHFLGMRSEAPGFATHSWQNGSFTSRTYVNSGNGRFVERTSKGQ
jgi:Icc protein